MQGRAGRCWRGCMMARWCRWVEVAAGWGLLALPVWLALSALLVWLALLGLLGRWGLLALPVVGLVVDGWRRC